jgi:hypothetical protein
MLKDAFSVVNSMEAEGVIERYALGGAVAATFYLEPIATIDVDCFVSFRRLPGSDLPSSQPIFDYLTARGHAVQGEYLIIAGWPVQFLPPTGPLVEEALARASQVDLEGEAVRVFSAEHLAAIALETGVPRTMRAWCSSWTPESWTRIGSSPSCADMACGTDGRHFGASFSEIRDDSGSASPPRRQAGIPAAIGGPADRRKAADAGIAA